MCVHSQFSLDIAAPPLPKSFCGNLWPFVPILHQKQQGTCITLWLICPAFQFAPDGMLGMYVCAGRVWSNYF